jgi:hypothetical protein
MSRAASSGPARVLGRERRERRKKGGKEEGLRGSGGGLQDVSSTAKR